MIEVQCTIHCATEPVGGGIMVTAKSMDLEATHPLAFETYLCQSLAVCDLGQTTLPV